MKLKKFTILHSNDMHGDFFAEDKKEKGKLIGGLSLLSGYINKVRQTEKNVLYVISGDMLQGSIIDTEYKGISTIEIMNYLSPDIVALGNHEFDYGLPHLLFLEKVAKFPIVNANLYIKKYNKRLMKPYKILKIDGFDILFTGIITEDVSDSLKQDPLIGSFISLEEASEEVDKICTAYKNDDIDLTILLTHIGFDSDKKLASMIKPENGVDMIIGGHSHTILEKPEKINNILIAQAGVGTDQIGRFDIWVDDNTNSIVRYEWKLIKIDDSIAEPDTGLTDFIDSFQKIVDRKYNTILCKTNDILTHPAREIETTLGDVFADAVREISGADVVFIGSGSIRVPSIGPVITLKDFLACFPYNDSLIKYTITGKQLKNIFNHITRPENRNREGECYQVNAEIKMIYNENDKRIEVLKLNDKDISDKKIYTIAIQGYHAINSLKNLSLSEEELIDNGKPKVITTSLQEALKEYFLSLQNIQIPNLKRLIYK